MKSRGTLLLLALVTLAVLPPLRAGADALAGDPTPAPSVLLVGAWPAGPNAALDDAALFGAIPAVADAASMLDPAR